MKNDNPRAVAAKIRLADYAHPGGEQLIDTLLSHLEAHHSMEAAKILDVGCWRGGTANYIKNKCPSLQSISGIDIDSEAIHYATATYKNIDFSLWDINYIDKINKRYDLLYLINVYYILSESLQKDVLLKFSKVAQKNAILTIADYTLLQKDAPLLKDVLSSPMHPISLKKLNQWLPEAGWEIVEVVDLNRCYNEWYTELLQQFHYQKSALLSGFTERAISLAESAFLRILENLVSKMWGGAIIYARYCNL